jgi:putative transposase
VNGGRNPTLDGGVAQQRDVYGIEPICRPLPIAPSTYYRHAGRRSDPVQWSA